MSTALAIAGVTAVLRDRLNDWLVDQDVASLIGSSVTVSVLAARPRGARRTAPSAPSSTSSSTASRRTSAGRNRNLPAHDATGRVPAGERAAGARPALPDLGLLGQRPARRDPARLRDAAACTRSRCITREMIRTALNPAQNPELPPALSALADSGLADQVEQLRITPQYLSTDEISQALDGDAVELPADRGLRHLGGADRGRRARCGPACRCCRGARSTRRPGATAASW